MIAITVENTRPTDSATLLKLVFRLDAEKDVPGNLRQIESRIVLADADRLLAAVDTSQCPLLKVELAANVLTTARRVAGRLTSRTFSCTCRSGARSPRATLTSKGATHSLPTSEATGIA